MIARSASGAWICSNAVRGRTALRPAGSRRRCGAGGSGGVSGIGGEPRQRRLGMGEGFPRSPSASALSQPRRSRSPRRVRPRGSGRSDRRGARGPQHAEPRRAFPERGRPPHGTHWRRRSSKAAVGPPLAGQGVLEHEHLGRAGPRTLVQRLQPDEITQERERIALAVHRSPEMSSLLNSRPTTEAIWSRCLVWLREPIDPRGEHCLQASGAPSSLAGTLAPGVVRAYASSSMNSGFPSPRSKHASLFDRGGVGAGWQDRPEQTPAARSESGRSAS